MNSVVGDGIMALFGAPVAHEDHAVRACYVALRMQEAVRRYATELRRTHGVEIQIRVGVNSGEVVVHSIGSDLRMDYAAVGQATQLAARMEQLAAPGSIRTRESHTWPALIPICAAITYLSAGRIDEAAAHAHEALTLTRRLGARAGEAHALALAADVASVSGRLDAEDHYRDALALASELAMRPLIAHCHLGVGRLLDRAGQIDRARTHLTTATAMYQEMAMPFWAARTATAMNQLAC